LRRFALQALRGYVEFVVPLLFCGFCGFLLWQALRDFCVKSNYIRVIVKSPAGLVELSIVRSALPLLRASASLEFRACSLAERSGARIINYVIAQRFLRLAKRQSRLHKAKRLKELSIVNCEL